MRRTLLLLLVVLSVLTTGCDRFGFTLIPDLTVVRIPQSFVRLAHSPLGFEVKHPEGMVVDMTMAPVQVTLENGNMVVTIYRQNNTDSRSYVGYGNNAILSGRDNVEIIKNTDKLVKFRRVRELWWKRTSLDNVEGDKPYYASVDIVTGLKETFSLHFRATTLEELQAIAAPMVRSFKKIKTQGDASIAFGPKERPVPLTPEAQALLARDFSGSAQQWGLFEPEYPKEPERLQALEEKLDYSFNYVLLYSSFDTPSVGERLRFADEDGRIAVLTLQTLSPKAGYTTATTYQLLSGKYDEYLKRYAQEVAEFGKPVLFRLNNEMNGDWCAYSAFHSSKDASLFVETWKYVYGIFEEAGANNAIWVWNPHDVSFPDFNWNHSMVYYPGDEYVDIVGLTGYNAGTYYKGEEWRGFREIYDPLYAEYDKVFAHKPLMITEFASNSVGGDKVAWINEAMAHMKDYPRISVSIWWNHIDFDGSIPARVYKLDETEQTLGSFRKGLEGYK